MAQAVAEIALDVCGVIAGSFLLLWAKLHDAGISWQVFRDTMAHRPPRRRLRSPLQPPGFAELTANGWTVAEPVAPESYRDDTGMERA